MKTERLGDHATFLSGFAFKSNLFNSEGKGTPIIRIRDVIRGRSETYFSGEYDQRYLVNKGDYLIGMDGEFNLARWNSEPALLNQRVCKIDSVSRSIDRAYLGRFLPAALKRIEDATPFVTVKHLSVKALNDIDIPLPPLAEQKRIAAILDAADALRAKRREAIAQLDALLQSSFLTLFGDPFDGNSKTSHVPFEDLTERITYGFTSPMSHMEEGIPILTAKNIQDGFIDFEKVHYADQTEFDALTDKSKPSPGDILITKDGTIGRCAEVPNCGVICINQSVTLVIPNRTIVIPTYLSAYIRSNPVQQRIQRMGKGNALKHLQITELAKFPAIIPPLPLQQKFAAIVESIERQKTTQRAHLAELDALFAALQHRAFRGEL